MSGQGAPSLRRYPEHVGHRPADARRVVQLLLRLPLVDEARLALWLVLRDVPSARPLKPELVRWEPAPEPSGPLL